MLAVLAGLTGLAQLAVIEAQQFEYGGEIVDGPSHKYGGVKYSVGRGPRRRIVELEGGEGVINKRSMAIPGVREKASALNELGGGRRFPGVKATSNYVMPPRMELGGMVAVQQQAISQQQAQIDYNKMTTAFLSAVQSLPAPIVGVGDVIDGITKKVRVQNRADIG